jgi:hypothetical protein
MTRTALAALLFAFPSLAAADVNVRLAAGKLDVTARAPLSEVLDRIGRQTGMKVVYDGAPPRQLVATDLHGVSTAQAVRSLLEGQNINYAAAMDRSGQQVTTLMIVGAGARPGQSTAPVPTPAPAISTGYDPSDAEINGEDNPTGDLVVEDDGSMPADEEEAVEPEMEPESEEPAPEKGARPDAPAAAPGVWPQPRGQLGVFSPFPAPTPNSDADAEAPIEDPEPPNKLDEE